MKKVLVVFLVFAYMNCYMGCTSTKIVQIGVEDNELNTNGNDMPLTIITYDSVHYYFEENSYTFKNDTLIGRGLKNNEEQMKWIKIPFGEIQKIHGEQKEYSSLKTVVLVVVLLGVVLFVLAWGTSAALSEMNVLEGS